MTHTELHAGDEYVCMNRRPAVEKYLAIVDLGLESLQVLGDRRAERLAGLDLEPAAMQRALDHVAFLETVDHRREAVGADVARRVDVAIDIVEGDFLVADLHLDGLFGFDFARVSYVMPVVVRHGNDPICGFR